MVPQIPLHIGLATPSAGREIEAAGRKAALSKALGSASCITKALEVLGCPTTDLWGSVPLAFITGYPASEIEHSPTLH